MDHNPPTWPLTEPVTDPIAKEQLDALERNCKEFGIRLEDRFSALQGIVHVIGPELGGWWPPPAMTPSYGCGTQTAVRLSDPWKGTRAWSLPWPSLKRGD